MTVTIADDFDLRKIMDSGQCFRIQEIRPGLFRFILQSNVLYIRQLAEDCYDLSCSEEEWAQVWLPYFDLNRNYTALRRQISDPFLQEASTFGKGIRILRQDPWETLISFIVSQRKSIPAIRKSIEMLCSALGDETVTPYETVHAFPTAAALASAPVSLLEECRLGYRVPYIHSTAQYVAEGGCSLIGMQSMSDESLMEALMSLKGVGIKVASCICLFGYSRTGLAPVDTWIRRIIDTEYGGADPFPQYGSAAGIMQQYAFFFAQNHKGRYSAA